MARRCWIDRRYVPIIAIAMLLVRCSSGSWMWLGMLPARLPEKLGCSQIPGLPSRQIEVCKQKPDILGSIQRGARTAIQECQSQFKHERWNCSTTSDYSVFGQELTRGSRETAFIYAVASAGLVYSITRGCSAGEVSGCSCDASLKGGSQSEGWQWGGCSDDIRYGLTFGRKFVDAAESAAGGHNALMNLHNVEAGRQAASMLMTTHCRCHGVSGSCAVKTCWRGMASFDKVGKLLKDKYEESAHVVEKSQGKLRRRGNLHGGKHAAHKDELVHVADSPDYCVRNGAVGTAGTKGRECDKFSDGPEGCGSLCCGRGYNTHVVRHAERCECKFMWCCYVRCRVCETLADVQTCK
ncbi:protein Wnt-16 isoform X1 [Lethenteron reissneri]|uniref:protein Wnt-16 isoform X1 n=1 Tax=Lethenteron reissneri TaxID=7753 RepID=UPI002AB7C6CD|nr:protein Wnt-16 isoform X1 [Lethenteron reissneri]